MKTEGIYLFLLDLIQRNCLFLSMDEKKIAQQILKLSPTLRSAFMDLSRFCSVSLNMFKAFKEFYYVTSTQ